MLTPVKDLRIGQRIFLASREVWVDVLGEPTIYEHPLLGTELLVKCGLDGRAGLVPFTLGTTVELAI